MTKHILGKIAPIQQGVVAKGDTHWLLNLDMVESNTGRVLDYLYVKPEEIGNSTIMFDTGNVLYSKLRPYLNKVVLPDRDGYATSEMLPLRPDTSIITREYLTYYLRSPHFVQYINGKTSGAKMPRASVSDLMALEIECPTIERQKQITTILEKIVSLINLYNKELTTLDDFAKSQFVEMFGDPVENPQKWAVPCLKSIIEHANNGMTRRGNDEAGSIVLRLVELQSGYLDYTAPNRIVLTEQETSRFLLKCGDFLFARVNGNPENVGRCTYFKGFDEPVYHNDHIIRVRFKPQTISPEYLQHLLNSPYGRNEMRDKIKTSAGQYTINQEGIGSIRIPLPPLPLQNEFATFVKQLDKSKLAIRKSLDELQLLYDSLMQEYFG
ncbi:MAG: restriction endonuclease subunit S [Victivallales bacterium]|nr:restriction endonuclease subunit S [Victivallales bacterium]